MRRKANDKIYNNNLLKMLFDVNSKDGKTTIISEMELRANDYRGSYPYTVPTIYYDYGIFQLPKDRGAKWNTYSILKLKATE